MSRILFAWELGANYGHLSVDLPVAQRLRADGHEVSFVVRDLRVAEEILHPRQFSFIGAPCAPTPRQALPINYAELLLMEGLGDALSFGGLMHGWSALYDLMRPDVLALDHAPGALICAKAFGLPAVLIGSGFTIPPRSDPLPSIRPWEDIERARLERADALALQIINGYLMTSGVAPLERLSELFRDRAALLTGFAELDHYGPRAGATYLGLIESHSGAAEACWEHGPAPRVFAYLRPMVPHVKELLMDLEECGAQVICVMPGAGTELRKHFESSTVRLLTSAVALTPLLKSADLVVGYGGAGLTTKALLSGVPLLLVPETVEQYLGALRVGELGAGIIVRQQQGEVDFGPHIHRLLQESVFRLAARRFAGKYQDFDSGNAIAGAADAILEAATRK